MPLAFLLTFPFQALAAQSSATLLTDSQQSVLRGDIADVLLAGSLLALGIGALGLSAIRSGSAGRPLIYFGLFCVLYGLRLILATDILRSLAGIPYLVADYGEAFVTYVIPLPGLLFVQSLSGPGWKSSLRWMLRLQLFYTTSAVLIDSFVGSYTAMAPNNALVILGQAVMIGNTIYYFRQNPDIWRSLRGGRDVWIVAGGVATLVIFSINENLVSAGAVPWTWAYEGVGVLALVVCLGFVMARRFVTGERKLVAISQEMETARRIQTSILPREMPDLPGLGIAARYLPMADVGGDFFDFLHVDRARLGILVADVSGHGVPAALIASMVKIALASQAANAGEPVEVLAGMNRVLHGKLERGFVTAAYLFLDLEANRVEYASAGHPPLLLRSGGEGSVREVRLEALPLGRFRQATYRSTELSLAPGDRLLLYTDGVVEAANPGGEPFGEERLRDFLLTGKALSADRLADSMLERLAAWSGQVPGSALQDDVTVMVVDRH